VVDSNTGQSQVVSPLGHLSAADPTVSGAGLSVSARTDIAVLQLFSRRGEADALAAKLGIGAKPGQASIAGAITALPLSPGQWLLVSSSGREGEFCEEVSGSIAGTGFVSEQSHSRIVFRVSGRNARKVMQKGCRLDLHPTVASSGFCAQTSMAQTGVLIHQVDDTPTYDLYVYSGFADAFWRWLSHSAAEYTIE